MDIVIIGSGNVAAVLGRKFIAAGHHILQVVGRNAKAASTLAYEWNTVSTNYQSAINKNADVYIIAPLYKRMIQEIHKRFGPVQSYVAHSFGGLAVSLALEETSHTNAYKLVLIAPAAETTTAVDSFFRFLRLDPTIRQPFEKIIIKSGGISSEWYSIRRAMKHIQAKVLWVQDEDDDVTPLSDVLKVKAENYPNINFVITKGLGHRRIYRDNKVVKLIVDFL